MRQWQVLAAIALTALIFAAGLFLGMKWQTANQAAEAIQQANDRLDSVLDAQKAANESAAKLQKTLDRLPRAEKKVNDAVRDNPSPCARPAAVADSLQAGVREANAARALPEDR